LSYSCWLPLERARVSFLPHTNRKKTAGNDNLNLVSPDSGQEVKLFSK
jgi:hypothetical protein